MLVLLGDSLPANKLRNDILSYLLHEALVWSQRCEMHAGTWVTIRPFVVCELLNPIFCLAKLPKDKFLRQRLGVGMKALARSDLRNGGILQGTLPTEDDVRYRDDIFNLCIASILSWCDDSTTCDIFPRLQHLKVSIKAKASLWKKMFSQLSANTTSHACPFHCCASDDAVVEQVLSVIDE